MTNEQKQPENDMETDEPSEEEIEREKRKEKTWKHDDSQELSEPDRKF
ncbi:hypothetical protein [Pseudomonas koreensis]